MGHSCKEHPIVTDAFFKVSCVVVITQSSGIVLFGRFFVRTPLGGHPLTSSKVLLAARFNGVILGAEVHVLASGCDAPASFFYIDVMVVSWQANIDKTSHTHC
eukprot:5967015-Amphidinium_carterae.1